MYRIKQIPEDFVVEEKLDLRLDDGGRYAYYRLKKTNYNTMDAVTYISRALKIAQKYINFAGTKDRNALTTQFISISDGPKKDFSWKDIELSYLGDGNERLNLGSLTGNRFCIVVRNLEENLRTPEPGWIPNYFGEQRFGTEGNNAGIGRLILRRDFKGALRLIDPSEASENPIQALRKLPRRLLQMYIHAFQSELWNCSVSRFLRKHSGCMRGDLWFPQKVPAELKGARIPVIGFSDEDIAEGPAAVCGRITRELLSEHGLTQRDFILREMPELCAEGDQRRLFIDISEFRIDRPEPDDLNPGKNKCRVSFFLPKGCYATVVIKALFG